VSYLGRLQQIITDRAPYWIGTGPGGVFLQACGLLFDDAQATLLHGLRQTRPGTAFVDALSLIAADRGIKKYPTEPIASWRARLQRWRQIKRHAGSHYGQMINLQPYFLPGAVPTIRIVHQSGDGAHATWHTLAPDGTYSVYRPLNSNWNWDTNPGAWSRFWVIIYVNGIGSDGAKYGDGTVFGDGVTVYGGHLDSAQIADIVSIIIDSKAAHSALWGVILATDPASFDPTTTAQVQPDGSTTLPISNWGSTINPVTGLPSRLDTARFPYDLGAA
jgi:hypothetical protein